MQLISLEDDTGWTQASWRKHQEAAGIREDGQVCVLTQLYFESI